MRVLGIIPARGGSKGVHRKNIRPLCGKPLLAYTAEAAISARLTKTILSTEDEEIADIGRSLGLDVPFMRPVELAEDATATFPVILHAVTKLESLGEHYDAVCLLQPTNPLRRTEDIDNCIEILEKTGADSVISILPVPHVYNPKWVYWRSPDGEMKLSSGDVEPVSRRQDLPPAFHREGSVYVTKRSVLTEYGNLYGRNVRGYEMDEANSINIDTKEDWSQAEEMIKSRSIQSGASQTV
ncbi:MAG: acylneuraminate cytidylyltransferase family protein [Chloracidobacterium sp.]|nr:acylneuraminate cytidylyltransferase family protein [Chloracidobacterium sp.]